MAGAQRHEGEPLTRLQRLGDAALDAVRAHPEYREGDTVLVCVDDDHAGGLSMWGFADDGEAFSTLLGHVGAIAEVNGVKIVTMRQDPGTN